MSDHELRQSLAAGLPEGYALQEGNLGSGGFGRVYPATFTIGERTKERAVKVLADYGDAFSRRSFIEEGEHLANLSAHPNIITVHERGDFFHPPAGAIRVPYIAMERAKCSFNELPQGTNAPTNTVVNHLLGAIDGMAYVHNDAGSADQVTLLHRDIKPGNLLLGRDGKIKITDFGVARPSDTGEQNSQQTKLLRVFGTGQYLDTDSFAGKPSRASDIYALGILGYKAISGADPLVNHGLEQYWPSVHAFQPVPHMPTAGHSKNNAYCIEYLDPVFQKALEKHASDRHESMTAFGEAIRSAMAQAENKIRTDKRYFTDGKMPGVPPKPPTKRYTEIAPLPTLQKSEQQPDLPKPGPSTPLTLSGALSGEPFSGEKPALPAWLKSTGDHHDNPWGGGKVPGTADESAPGSTSESPHKSAPRRPRQFGLPSDTSEQNGDLQRNPLFRGRTFGIGEDMPPASRRSRERSFRIGGENARFEYHSSRSGDGFGRRRFLTFVGLGAVAAGGIYFRKDIANFFGTPDPEKTASPEQLGTDYIGKNIVDALLDGQTEDKQQAAAVLRDLARLNPDWARDKMLHSGPRWDFAHQFYNRLFIENPDAAYAELERLKQQNFTWDAVALMATFASGYAMIEKPSIQQEKDRLVAHDKYANMGTQAAIMIKGLEILPGGADTTNWRQLLASAMDPDGKEGTNKQSLTTTLKNFIASGDYASAGALGVALAAQKPETAARALKASVDYALEKDTVEAYGFVRVLADGMAPYETSRAHVIEQMKRINSANNGDNAREATNHMAVSIGPFDPDAVIDYVQNNMQFEDAQLALLVVGDRGQKALQTLRPKVSPSNQIWYDLAIDPTKREAADTALNALKNNALVLRRSGALIGAALVNGRRFADIF